MLLPDFMYMSYIDEGIIDVDPSPAAHQIQPASLDLTLEGNQGIGPKEFQIWSTRERIRLPTFIQGQIHGRSSLAREGIMVHIAAGFVDPGFDGQLTLEVVNFSHEFRVYEDSTRIAQIAFLLLCAPARFPYKGHYQNQRGPTLSRRDRNAFK